MAHNSRRIIRLRCTILHSLHRVFDGCSEPFIYRTDGSRPTWQERSWKFTLSSEDALASPIQLEGAVPRAAGERIPGLEECVVDSTSRLRAFRGGWTRRGGLFDVRRSRDNSPGHATSAERRLRLRRLHRAFAGDTPVAIHGGEPKGRRYPTCVIPPAFVRAPRCLARLVAPRGGPVDVWRARGGLRRRAIASRVVARATYEFSSRSLPNSGCPS